MPPLCLGSTLVVLSGKVPTLRQQNKSIVLITSFDFGVCYDSFHAMLP